MPARWEHFPHGADIGVRGVASTIDGAFEQAALALSAIVSEPESLAAKVMIDVECEAPDAELLLVDWLNALIYETATRHLLFGRFEVQIEGSRLKARVWGQAIDLGSQDLTVEPKGATYTALSVRREDGSWVAECVVDV
jgi:tRNA nucleotidyltransferase (CCA-adding enzyme)